MTKEEKALTRYKLLSKIVLHESKAMWDTAQLFLISNTILATIIGALLTTNSGETAFKYRLILIGISLLGLCISILWGFSYNRTTRYYKFRMAQAREIEPEGFNIFNGIPKSVAEGNTHKIDGEKYSVRVLGWNFQSLKIVNIIIVILIN